MDLKDNFIGIQHIGIPTNDLEKTIEFYLKLGFDVKMRTFNEEAQEKVAFLSLGNLTLETFENKNAAMKIGAVDHIAINVKDIEGAYKYICDGNLNNMNDEIHFLPFWENGVKYFIIQGVNMEKIEFSQYL